ncbi:MULTISPECIES: rhomboid family intramembrane serine protease [unclassified Pseudoalteromonas]|uniref:rhomboid family intramembrane serine protease n=1 Tax=unclassified Pseudoalteromonas TaxID=194690 RepID=UPI000C0870E6|nr:MULTISPECIES: rhomboid family intramembrane serine protease [unclassified Pseudoalteromonas]MDP2635291.1 rhomboid family intramembrane serine protease [Pseudoalteromonas sp. 1_MG-2023]PHN90891.1 rhomboid family intramembrane serine protease [Pseudoalteromonas sp. 3D05]TGE84283.1 rhomboid family intramembrane serine protease [Pseudoalteromonas sp. KS88]
MPSNSNSSRIPPLSSKRFTLIGIILLCTVLQVVNSLPGINLNGLGIYPRSLSGLTGIFFAPFLHGGWAHLISNLIPFAVLGWLVCQYSIKRFWLVFIFTALGGGLLVWLFGRGNIHVGLSGVLYGLWGFLICYGLMLRSFKAIVISVVVVFLYSGFIWGVLPQRPHVSFESHLFGAIAGVLIGYYLAKKDKVSLTFKR